MGCGTSKSEEWLVTNLKRSSIRCDLIRPQMNTRMTNVQKSAADALKAGRETEASAGVVELLSKKSEIEVLEFFASLLTFLQNNSRTLYVSKKLVSEEMPNEMLYNTASFCYIVENADPNYPMPEAVEVRNYIRSKHKSELYDSGKIKETWVDQRAARVTKFDIQKVEDEMVQLTFIYNFEWLPPPKENEDLSAGGGLPLDEHMPNDGGNVFAG